MADEPLSELSCESRETRVAIGRPRRAPRTPGNTRLAASSSSPAGIEHRPSPVRTKVDNGWLRRDPAVGGMVIGHGSQRACDGCDGTILFHHVEVRLRFRDGAVLRFHRRCFKAWLACIRRQPTPRSA